MIPVALYVGLGLSLVVPVIMMEDVRAVPSLGRSWSLVRDHRWSIFAALFVIGLLAGVVSFVVGIALSLLDPVAAVFAQAAVTVILSSWPIISLAVAYDRLEWGPRFGALRGTYVPPPATAIPAAPEASDLPTPPGPR